MRITIEYESSWRNSFLSGSNNEPLPKGGRKFLGSMTQLKNADNYLPRDVTLDTVMGILNRLIGDQRKLYQSRSNENYFFREIESNVRFRDIPKCSTDEMVYIRNITGNTDPNSYTGMIIINDPIFTSDYSEIFWAVLSLEIDDLCRFILDDSLGNNRIELNPLSIVARFEKIYKLKPIEKTGLVAEAFDVLDQEFEKFSGINNKGQVMPRSLYCSALYLQLERLSKRYSMESAKTKAGGISGISHNNFTKKNFMGKHTTGGEKKVWGNPYMRDKYVEGQGKTKQFLKKVSGKLEIELDLEAEQSRTLHALIQNAGVSSFYLGKKGLAYVSNIRA